MIIRKLELRNWGPYAGDHEILFASPDETRRIQLVRGENGHGKTHLLRALVIALHGKEGMQIVDPSSRPKKASYEAHLESFLKDALTNGAADGPGPQMRLRIDFDEGDKAFGVERSWWFEGSEVVDEELVVFLDGEPYAPKSTRSEDQYEEKQALIKARIPHNVLKFFFFDGEEIKSIAESDPSGELSKGLEALLGLKLLDDLQSDLEKARSKFSSEHSSGKRLQSEISALDSEIANLEADETELGDKLRAAENERARLAEEIAQLERKAPPGFDGSAGPDGHKVDIASRIEEAKLERENVLRKLADFASNQLALSIPAQLLAGTSERIAREEELRRWEDDRERLTPECSKLTRRMFGDDAPKSNPPLADGQLKFYRELLEQEWRNILQPPPEGLPAEEWFEAFTPDLLRQASDVIESAQSGSLDDLRHYIDEDERLGSDITRFSETLENYAASQELGNLFTEIRSLSEAVGQKQSEIRSLKNDLAETGEQLAEKRRERANKMSQAASSDEIREQVQVASDLLEVVATFRDRLKSQRVEDLESSIREMMTKLAHKGEDQFHAVEVDPKHFTLTIRDRDGYEVKNASAGEREILALSLLWALGETSRRSLPLVIDTPLGRLDRSHRQNIVDHFLPTAAGQVIILATEEEITDERRRRLADSLVGELELRFDSATRTTTVGELEAL